MVQWRDYQTFVEPHLPTFTKKEIEDRLSRAIKALAIRAKIQLEKYDKLDLEVKILNEFLKK